MSFNKIGKYHKGKVTCKLMELENLIRRSKWCVFDSNLVYQLPSAYVNIKYCLL